MTKIAIISDIHLGARNDLPIFLDFHEKFFSQVFFPKLDELGIKTVINLGDTFDRRKYLNYKTLHRSKSMFFDELAKRQIWSPIIIGNHDTYHNNTNFVNSIELVCGEFHYPNLKIINDPQMLDVHGFNILMIPWICQENQKDCMWWLENAPTDLCMGHFAINGFLMYSGSVAENGMNRRLFDKYDMVFSGHFHHRSSDGRIYYVGNPCELTWQDFGDTKGFHIFDLETRNLTFIPNPFQMFHRIIYNDELYVYHNDDNMSPYSNVYVKVVIEKKNKPKMYDMFLANLYKVNPFSVSIVQNYADVIEIPNDFIPDQAEGTVQLLKTYIDKTDLPPDINKDTLKGLFSDIYQEALNVES